MRHFLGMLMLLASSAFASTTDVKILVDSDKNPATGCRVITAAGNFDGAEHIYTTTFDNSTMTVTGVTHQQCVDPATATFGMPTSVDAGGWRVGTSGGNQILETHVPAVQVGGVHSMRFGFVVNSGTLTDVMLQRPGGGAIIFIPEIERPGRPHVVASPGGRAITLDGDAGEWAGIVPLVSGGGGGSPALRFTNISATETTADLFFLVFIQANPKAPTATPDTYPVLRGSTLTIVPPGVLTNDSDPQSKPLTAVLIEGPHHGMLSLNANGSFSYTNDGSAAPNDSFVYKASNGTDDSNAAQVTLDILSGTPPSITSPPTTTFTVGTPGSFTVTKSGNPTPTLSESGALPTGVTFSPSTSLLAGTPAVGTGGAYSIIFTASNPIGTATQNFTLNVNEGPAITSANATTMIVGTAGSFIVTASGFPPPAILEAGALPAGVTYNSTTHAISGTPATPGVFNITFTASNLSGTATQNFTLTVNQAPAITSANATTFTVGMAGTFTVTATGSPAPALGESGALPMGVTFNTGSGVLSGTPATGTGGTYNITFTATNSAGTATQNFTLTVNEAPAITTAAANLTVCAGATATFTAAASGFPAPTVQWQVSSGGPFTNIPGATSTTLSFTAAASDNNNQYRAVFTNGSGTAQTTATLTVSTPPAVTTSPTNQTACAGTNATFTAAASGTPAPTVQ